MRILAIGTSRFVIEDILNYGVEKNPDQLIGSSEFTLNVELRVFVHMRDKQNPILLTVKYAGSPTKEFEGKDFSVLEDKAGEGLAEALLKNIDNAMTSLPIGGQILTVDTDLKPVLPQFFYETTL